MFFSNVDSQRLILDYLNQVLPAHILEAFVHTQIFIQTMFCLGEKQVVLVSNECSSLHNKVSNFYYQFWERKQETLYSNGSAWMA